MNTPAHMIVGMAAFGRPGQPAVTAAALLGSFLPDLSLYAMVLWARFVNDVPARTIFREYYYSDQWMAVFAVDNSFFIWGAVLGLAVWRRSAVLVALSGAGVLHLIFDFMLHNEDARPQFWPLTDWKFLSPISYWDRSHFAAIVGPAEVILCVVLSAWMMFRFKSLGLRVLILALLALEFSASGTWHIMV